MAKGTVEKRPLTEEEIADAKRLMDLWLKFKKDDKKITQTWLAKETGIGNQSSVSQYLNADIQLNPKAVMAFAKVLKVPPSSISPRMFPGNSLPVQFGYARIGRLNVEAMGGYGSVAPDHIEVVQHIDVAETFIKKELGNVNPANIRVITARGQSMSGQIESGDILFVELTNTFTDDGPYVICVGGFVRVKNISVSLREQCIRVESTDGSKPELFGLNEIDQLYIQGRVLGAWTLKKFF